MPLQQSLKVSLETFVRPSANTGKPSSKSHRNNCMCISMVDRTTVLCPQNLFLRKSQRYITFVFSTLAVTMSSIIDKTTMISLTFVKLLAINILYYFDIKEVNDSLGIKSTAGLKDLKHLCSKWMDITPLCIHSSLMNCWLKSFFFVSVIN